MKKRPKHPEEMSAVELDQFTARFDLPFAFENSTPMTKKERAQERKLRRRRGRPKIGKGARKISISLESSLLRDTDALARKTGLNRSELISHFLTAGLKRKAG